MYLCGACGKVAATVTLVPPGQPDPRPKPKPPAVPPGTGKVVSEVFPSYARLAIDGGPVSLTRGPVSMERVTIALRAGSAAALFEIEQEYAPFWCPKCRASYCREHYRSWPVFDDCFFDCLRGVCPKGHERILED
jgi:hypothetical protein